MAKVEYISGKSFNASVSESNSIYTGNYTVGNNIVIPIIKCTVEQLEALVGTLPQSEFNTVRANYIYNSDFQSLLGLDLTAIVNPGATDDLNTFQSAMITFGNLLPSIDIIFDSIRFNSTMWILGIDYNTTSQGAIDGHAGVITGQIPIAVQGSPCTVSNEFYESGGSFTSPRMSVYGSCGFGFSVYIDTTSSSRPRRLFNHLWFQCTDNELYCYRLGCYNNSLQEASITKVSTVWQGNPQSYTSYSWDSIAYLLAKSDKSILKFELSVVNGTGGGRYVAGESVTVVAQSDTPGAIFARWEFSSNIDIQYGGTNTAAVSFLMPNRNVTATAVFIDPESNTRSVTVQNGSGTGTYEVGSSVTIVADSRENLYFAHWDVSVQGSLDSSFEIQWTYGGSNTASASFIMPDKNLTFYATYVNASGDFPYAGGGSSTPSPYTATWNKPEDDVAVPNLPNVNASAVQAGLVSMFTPTITELQSLGAFLWSDNFITDFADNIKKLLADPLDCIISLHLVPVAPSHGSTKESVNFGMVPSGVDMYRINNQYIEFDCGNLQIDNFSGSFMDYSPHTKYQLFLPFIGIEELDADEITGKSLGIKYHIDLLTGSCVAFISADSSLIASYNGQCSNPVPVSGANYSRTIAALIGVVATGAIAGASMGAGAGAVAMAMQNSPVRVGETVTGLAKAFNQTGSIGRGLPGVANIRRQIGAAIDNVMDVDSNVEFANRVSSSARALFLGHATNSYISDIMGLKGVITHSGNMGGSVGFLGKRTPYLITIRPNQSIPNNYGHFFGYPSNLSGQLSTFSGFTSCSVIEAKAISGTDSEMEELIELLKGGVFL